MSSPTAQARTEIYLQAWGTVWIYYVLDPTTGSHAWKIARRQEGARPTNGFASIEPVLGSIGRFYAVYVFQGRLYFQVGTRKWDITDAEVETKYWLRHFGSVSGFQLVLNGKSVNRATLLHPNRALWPFIDPTYDGIDLDSDHFLLFLSEHLTREEWRHAVLSMESNPREEPQGDAQGSDRSVR